MNIITRNLEPKEDSEILIERDSLPVAFSNVAFYAAFGFFLLELITGNISTQTAIICFLIAALFAKIHFSK